MPTVGATVIENIKSRRTFADRPVSDSDHSDHSTVATSRDSKNDSTVTTATEACGQTMAPGPDVVNAVPDTGTVFKQKQSTKAHRGGVNIEKESSSECFQTMMAEAASDPEEENDKVHTCIDFANIKFSGLTGLRVKPPMKRRCEIPDNLTELPCDIFYFNDKTVLQKFETFDELSEHLVNAAVHERDEISTQEFLKNLVRVPLTNAEHFITVGEYLCQLYADQHLIDVILDVQGSSFFAHRVALCCCSAYFAEFFESTKGSKTPYELKIKGVTAEAFAAFLEFCYTGEMTVSPGIAADILIMADFLKVTELKERCDIVAKSLPLDQSLKMVVRSKANTTGKLYNTLFSTVLEHFEAASILEPFLNLDVDVFCRMLESDELVVITEFDVFTIAVRWIVHDMEKRVKYTMRIMSLIRFYYMTQQELFMCVETTSLVRGYDKFREMILIANWLKTVDSLKQEDPFQFPKPNPRTCFLRTSCMASMVDNGNDVTLVMPPPVMTSTPKSKFFSPTEEQKAPTHRVDIFVVGGFMAEDNKEESKFVNRYDVADNQWLHFSGLPAPRHNHCVAVLDGNLYLIGGSEPCNKDMIPLPTNTVFKMGLESKKWSQICNMNAYRHSHCACTVKGLLYVIGGKGKYDSVLLSMECYNPQTEKWVFVPSLPEPLFGASAAALGFRILVTGGIGANKDIPSSLFVLKTVYSYNTITESWSKLNDLRFPRCLATLVNVCDRLYLCGGATRSYDVKNSVLCSVSAVDEYNITEDEWFHVADMVIPRHDAGAAVAGSRIYIIGGISKPADRVLQSIECYDTVTSVWVPGVQDLPYPARRIYCCAVLSNSHSS